MIPIWLFITFFVIFLAILIWERWDYLKLKDNIGLLEHYLDLYVSKYGTISGITIEDPSEDVDVHNTK